MNRLDKLHSLEPHRELAEFQPGDTVRVQVKIKEGEKERFDAPYVADCPAVLECELHKHVELGEAGALVLGHVRGVRLDHELPIVEGSAFVDSEGLRPVGRLWGFAYALLGEVRVIPRPGL